MAHQHGNFDYQPEDRSTGFPETLTCGDCGEDVSHTELPKMKAEWADEAGDRQAAAARIDRLFSDRRSYHEP